MSDTGFIASTHVSVYKGGI